VINGRTNAIVASIPIASGAFIGLQGVAVNPITDRIYVSDADNQQYIVIDGVTNSIIAQVPVFTQPAGIAVNPATNRVYLGSEGFPGGILVFNGRTNTFEGQIQEANGVEAVVTSFLLNRVYAAVGGPDSFANGSVAIVNGADFQLLADVPAGPFPHGIDVNLLNNRVYVANANGPSVTIIDGISGEVLQTLPIPARFVGSVAVNPVTGLTYLSDFESDQVIVLRHR
jgi:YVTN family beta-propeller protein